jgi:DNA invertase Pin-like site-specific DNA recombinase
MLAAVAQKKASAISSRTKEKLAAKKARGFQLGTPANLADVAKLKGLVVRQTNAQTNVNNRQAAQLKQSGYTSRRGNAFHPMGVQRLLKK